jgi:hypothetical protein
MNGNESSFGIIIGGVVALLVFIGVLIYYLNNVQNTGIRRLMKLLQPFDLSFTTINKQTYATGFIEKMWVAFNVAKLKKGKGTLIKMRIKLDLPLSAQFHISTDRARTFVIHHARKDPKSWPFVAGKFYVKINNPVFAPEKIVEAFSRNTRLDIENFEDAYQGVVIYRLDTSLFEQADKDLIQSANEIKNSVVLFTHTMITDALTTDAFNEFVYESVKLAREVEKDLRPICPTTEDEERKRAHVHKRLAAKLAAKKV